ncbi:hypothetical protein FS837_004488 [Tulasnella sp. UAMH 9824]|nr:hypothetical protein FS837_004488 [Tulasnella sp. UAMH 9824]
MHVQGPDVPDRIIANISDGDDEKDTQLVEDLAKMYINQPNCIFLLVITCETDFENQGAYRLIKSNGSLRSRVLTKPDRIELGNEGGWLKILRNESITLENGCLDEKHRKRTGTTALTDHLGQVLAELASKKLPQILARINILLEDVEKELKNYPAPTYDDPKREIIMLLRNFAKDVAKHIEGLPPSCTDDPVDPFTAGLIYSINKKYDAFRLQVHRTAPQFRPWEKRMDKSGVISPSERWKLLSALKEYDSPSGCGGKEFYLEEVMDLAERSRTREPQGNYPFPVKDTYINETIRTWRDLASNCFGKVRDIMKDHVSRLVEDHFGRYAHGGLLEAVSDAVKEQFIRREAATRKKIESICRGEDCPCTQNEDYFFHCRSELLVKYKATYRRSKEHGSIFGFTSENPRDQQRLVNEAIAALARLGLHGLKAEEMVRLFPESRMDPAYFQVAYKRFGDNIPNQIDASFVSGFDDDLELALVYTILDTDTCSEWLQESPQMATRRAALTDRKKRLEAAKDKLAPMVRQLPRGSLMEPSSTQEDCEEDYEDVEGGEGVEAAEGVEECGDGEYYAEEQFEDRPCEERLRPVYVDY